MRDCEIRERALIWGEKLLTVGSNPPSWALSRISAADTTHPGRRQVALFAIHPFVCVWTHSADGDGDAGLVHGADAFIMWGFDDRHLFLLLGEASDWHRAADAGVARQHRLPSYRLTALWKHTGGQRASGADDVSWSWWHSNNTHTAHEKSGEFDLRNTFMGNLHGTVILMKWKQYFWTLRHVTLWLGDVLGSWCQQRDKGNCLNTNWPIFNQNQNI